jgi:hypothetical protein
MDLCMCVSEGCPRESECYRHKSHHKTIDEWQAVADLFAADCGAKKYFIPMKDKEENADGPQAT